MNFYSGRIALLRTQNIVPSNRCFKKAYYLTILAASICLSCTKKSGSASGPLPPGGFVYPEGLLATVGLNDVNVSDTITLRVSNNLGNFSITSFDWTIIANNLGFLEKPRDTWALKNNGQYYTIKSNGATGRYLKYMLANVTGSTGNIEQRKTFGSTTQLSDSTNFILTNAGGNNFYIEPVLARGYYLSFTMRPFSKIEFVTGKQVFFMIAW